MATPFRQSPSLSLGVELELQLVDAIRICDGPSDHLARELAANAPELR